MTRAKKRLTLSLARRRMGFTAGGPTFRAMEPSRFLADLPPELFGLPSGRSVQPAGTAAPRGPVIRKHPGAIDGDPHIEMDEEPVVQAPRTWTQPQSARPAPRGPAVHREPTIDYDFDQRPEAGRQAFAPGTIVSHPSLGEGQVVSCEGAGGDAKVTVIFDDVGEKRVVARFLKRA
jgi:DNA helicase-2/ATP-dependent DNA helicase PcrA